MDSTLPNFSQSAVTIPPVSTDALLHALSATVIAQHGVITMMSGLVMQLYCSVNHIPPEEATGLFDRLAVDGLQAANTGFIDSLRERRDGLQDLLLQ